MSTPDVFELWQFPVGDALVVARRDVQGLFFLNGTARHIWDEFNRGAAPAEIVENFVSRYGLPRSRARRDVEGTLAGWAQGLLSPGPGNLQTRANTSVLRDCESHSTAVRIDCVLNGRGFRVLLEPGDLVEEISPRLDQIEVACLPPDLPFVRLALVNGEDRVFVLRDGVCVAEEETTSGARAILLQEMTTLCNPGRQAKVILHAGACGTASGCVILAGASHAGKSTLCAALMAEGFLCYSDDSAILDRHFEVAGMPFPLMLRESSWLVLESRFAPYMDTKRARVHRRFGCDVRFLPSNLPANSSPAVAPKALVFVDYQSGARTQLRPVTPFQALLGLRQGGFWVEHGHESIAEFLAWIGRARLLQAHLLPDRRGLGRHQRASREIVTRGSLRYAGAVWIVCVVALSLQPLRLRAASHGRGGHVVLHVALFGFAAVAPLLLSQNGSQEAARALYVLCLAGAVEIVQGHIYRFHTEWKDVTFDAVGILIAFLVIRLYRVRRNRNL